MVGRSAVLAARPDAARGLGHELAQRVGAALRIRNLQGESEHDAGRLVVGRARKVLRSRCRRFINIQGKSLSRDAKGQVAAWSRKATHGSSVGQELKMYRAG